MDAGKSVEKLREEIGLKVLMRYMELSETIKRDTLRIKRELQKNAPSPLDPNRVDILAYPTAARFDEYEP